MNCLLVGSATVATGAEWNRLSLSFGVLKFSETDQNFLSDIIKDN
jgi:hypothetical protein